MRIGVVHPGEMGASVAASLVNSGHHVGWVSAGRSEQTRARAEQLHGYDDLQMLCNDVEAMVCVCPPDAATGVAKQVGEAGFQGTYVDANAISVATATALAERVGPGYVDGGIIGPPAWKAGSTRLYLSGQRADDVANWFSDGPLAAISLGDANPSAASGLKMAYAAQTKGTSALLLAVNALAAQLGVSDALRQEWEISQPALVARSEGVARGTSPKAWRFAGEMREIAQTFEGAGLPGDFHHGAAQIYERMGELKDLPGQELAVVIESLLESQRNQ